MIECSNVSFSISNLEILRDVSFVWREAGCYTLLGPNGAGKTTLLRRLAGIDSLTEGNIFWHNQEISSFSLQKKAKWAAFLPQGNSAFSSDLSVWELMNFARYPYMNFFRFLQREEKDLAEFLLLKLELINFKNRKLNTLSGGELQKTHLAACLFQEPKFLFLDEPLSFLDIYFQEEICSFLKKWSCENGTQIIMVSHHLNWALTWSDEVIFLEKGKIAFKGRPRTIPENLIKKIYRGRLVKIQDGERNFFFPKGRW